MKSTLATKSTSQQRCVGILGTGEYARALAKRLLLSGYDVIMGSRYPDTRQVSVYDECLCGVQLTSLDDCIARCDLLLAALHVENFRLTLAPRAALLAGKVVVDVSNRRNRYSTRSNAQHLQDLLPQAQVVKAFNSVSSYAMEDSTQNHTRVFVAADEREARERVLELARNLGFVPCDMGGLRAARNMEAFVFCVFPGWKLPLFLTFGLFNLWALYCAYIYFIEKTAYRWEQVFLKVFNKPLCMTAITILAVTYLAGGMAGVVQVWRGTKYRPFPHWLACWMKTRRQLGLISLCLAMTHAFISAMMLNATYFSSWFEKPTVTIPANISGPVTITLAPTWMTWKGEVASLLGVTSIILLIVTGIASLPSVAASLNWGEWRCLQSRVGLAALTLAVAHVVAMGAPGWVKAGPVMALRSITFLSGLLPALTLLLRVTLAVPPLSTRLRRIRHGEEFTALCCGREVKRARPACCSAPTKGTLFTNSPAYSAISSEQDLDSDCGSCVNGATRSTLPTRQCDCSVV